MRNSITYSIIFLLPLIISGCVLYATSQNQSQTEEKISEYLTPKTQPSPPKKEINENNLISDSVFGPTLSQEAKGYIQERCSKPENFNLNKAEVRMEKEIPVEWYPSLCEGRIKDPSTGSGSIGITLFNTGCTKFSKEGLTANYYVKKDERTVKMWSTELYTVNLANGDSLFPGDETNVIFGFLNENLEPVIVNEPGQYLFKIEVLDSGKVIADDTKIGMFGDESSSNCAKQIKEESVLNENSPSAAKQGSSKIIESPTAHFLFTSEDDIPTEYQIHEPETLLQPVGPWYGGEVNASGFIEGTSIILGRPFESEIITLFVSKFDFPPNAEEYYSQQIEHVKKARGYTLIPLQSESNCFSYKISFGYSSEGGDVFCQYGNLVFRIFNVASTIDEDFLQKLVSITENKLQEA